MQNIKSYHPFSLNKYELLTDAMVNKDREEEVIKYHAQRFL
jgi:hypothetical protein